jgi:hypothetical protein
LRFQDISVWIPLFKIIAIEIANSIKRITSKLLTGAYEIFVIIFFMLAF